MGPLRVLVDHALDAKAPAIGKRIGHEVERSPLVPALRDRHRRPCAQGPLAAATTAHDQPLLPVKPVQLLVVHLDPFPGRQQPQTAITKPSALERQLT
jgi:hypothetical protein